MKQLSVHNKTRKHDQAWFHSTKLVLSLDSGVTITHVFYTSSFAFRFFASSICFAASTQSYQSSISYLPSSYLFLNTSKTFFRIEHPGYQRLSPFRVVSLILFDPSGSILSILNKTHNQASYLQTRLPERREHPGKPCGMLWAMQRSPQIPSAYIRTELKVFLDLDVISG